MTDLSCGEARRLAWGRRADAVLPVERGRGLAHIAQCPSCRGFVEDMDKLRGAVAAGAPPVALPADVNLRVRERVRESLDLAAGRGRRRILLTLAAAAALLLTLRSFPASSGLTVDRIVRHQRELLAQPGIESTDPVIVHEWLLAQAAFPVHVPTFPDARLTGATVTTIDGHTVVVMRFQVGSQFMIYASSEDLTSAPADSAFRSESHGGLARVAWRASGLSHAWIGALTSEHLVTFARRCADQARAAMKVARMRSVSPPAFRSSFTSHQEYRT
jgi:anti-sigma factor RsiW